MSLEEVVKVLGDITMADSSTYWIVGALTLVVFIVMRAMLPVKGLSVVFAPVIFWGGLAGPYAATIAGFVAIPEKNANVVATATLGMIAALIVMILLVRLVEAVTRIRRPLTNTGRVRA